LLWFLFSNKLQTQTICTENLQKTLSYKKLLINTLIKYWWNWHLVSSVWVFFIFYALTTPNCDSFQWWFPSDENFFWSCYKRHFLNFLSRIRFVHSINYLRQSWPFKKSLIGLPHWKLKKNDILGTKHKTLLFKRILDHICCLFLEVRNSIFWKLFNLIFKIMNTFFTKLLLWKFWQELVLLLVLKLLLNFPPNF